MLKRIKEHLKDNAGAEYFEAVILLLIAFVIGGILLEIMNNSLDEGIRTNIQQSLQNIFSW